MHINNYGLLDHTNYFHLSGTSGTAKGVSFIYLLDQPCPVFPVFTGRPVGFQDRGDEFIVVLLFPLAPGYITVVPIIPDHLFPFVGNMGTHLPAIADPISCRCLHFFSASNYYSGIDNFRQGRRVAASASIPSLFGGAIPEHRRPSPLFHPSTGK